MSVAPFVHAIPFNFPITSTHQEQQQPSGEGNLRITVEVLSLQCVRGVSGSAIKGVRLFYSPKLSTPLLSPTSRSITAAGAASVKNKNKEGEKEEILLASVGYDQRLSVWRVATATGGRGKEEATPSIPCHIQVYRSYQNFNSNCNSNSNSSSLTSKRKFSKEENSALSPSKEEELSCSNVAAPAHFTREHVQVCTQGVFRTEIGNGGESDVIASPLEWLGASVVNIGDVNGIALLSDCNSNGNVGIGEGVMIAVVGEGVQVFQGGYDAGTSTCTFY